MSSKGVHAHGKGANAQGKGVDDAVRAPPACKLAPALVLTKVLKDVTEFIDPIGRVPVNVASMATSGTADVDELRDKGILFASEQGWITDKDAEYVSAWYHEFVRAWSMLKKKDGLLISWDSTSLAWLGSYEERHRINESARLDFKVGDWTENVSFCNGLAVPTFEALYARGEPSPFGDLASQTTKIDLSVRQGRELRHGEHWTIGPAFVKYLERGWNQSMLPSRVKIVPHKLNMYREGGGFAWHSDTPEPGLIGTVLVGLVETGSEPAFQIKHGTESKHWRCADRHSPIPNIMFFYADCPHMVQVDSGIRATLTFKVFAQAQADQSDTDQSVPARSDTGTDQPVPVQADQPVPTRSDTGTEQVASEEETAEHPEHPVQVRHPVAHAVALQHPVAHAVALQQMMGLLRHTLKVCGAFGLILSHGYSMHGSTLKGADAHLLTCITSMPEFKTGDVDVVLVPVSVVTKFDGGWGECAAPEHISVQVYTMTDADLEHGARCIRDMQARELKKNSLGRVNTLNLTNIPFLTACDYDGGEKVREEFHEFCEHTGNQCQPASLESVYMHRAFIVTTKKKEEEKEEEETGEP